MVNIDTVYQRVLALANKEQRGYITPQEFNLFANQAQMDIFEQYFYDRAQFGRVPGNKTMYADPIDILEEKIEIFHKSIALTGSSNIFTLPSDLYRLARVNNPENSATIEKLTHQKFTTARNSPLTAPTISRPIYYVKGNQVIVSPNIIENINIDYIKIPTKVEWNGFVTDTSQLYNSDDSVNFELHVSEEPNLVLNVLKLAGIAMKDPSLYQIGAAEEAKDIQQEKQ
jgi:hypothetical protein|tara:strand:+ start:15 stop:698 length:684 start_codon:yes stop_codon:yes gene_type:complete